MNYYDRVYFLASAGGLADFVVASAQQGYRTPASAGVSNGAQVSYVAESANKAEWEVGVGTYTTAGTTLSRTTIRASSNAGSKVNFSVAPTVFIDLLAVEVSLIETREPAITAGTTAQYWRGDKTFQTLDKAAVGLANVDNTSDANKPVSTAQAAADALRVLKAGDTMTGNLVIDKVNPLLDMRKAASGQFVEIVGRTGANLRWGVVIGGGTSESGSNVGSDFHIHRYDDAGAALGIPLTIARSTGVWTLNDYTASTTLELNASKQLQSVVNPSFSVHRNGSNQSIASSGEVKIQFTTEEFDTNNNFDNATNFRFQPTVAGKYVIHLAMAFVTLPGGAVYFISIHKNGARYKDSFPGIVGVAGISGTSVSAIVAFNGTTDYVEGYCYHEGGAGINLDGRATVSYMDGIRIGP